MKSRKLKFGIVYKATNTVNNKVYIGQTWRYLSERIWNHTHHSGCAYFSNAINKYGIDNFIWEIIFKSNDQNVLDAKEDSLIKEYKSNIKNFGYNLRLGGSCGKFSKASKEKMRQSAIAYFSIAGSREKHSKVQLKRFDNFEEKVKLSRAHGGKPFYAMRDNELKLFQTQVEAAEYIGSTQGSIKSALKGYTKEIKGWIFSYSKITEYKSTKHIKYQKLKVLRKIKIKHIKFDALGWDKELSAIWGICSRSAREYLKRNFPEIYHKAYNIRSA